LLFYQIQLDSTEWMWNAQFPIGVLVMGWLHQTT
jgi:hypothetical protein